MANGNKVSGVKGNKVGTAILGCLVLSGCATLYEIGAKIPGLDRILHKESTAQVGPVKTRDGQVIAGTETDAALSQDSSVPDPIAQPQARVSPATEEPVTDQLAKRTPVDKKAKPQAKPQPPKLPVPKPAPLKNGVLSGTIKLLTKSGEISAEGVIVRLKRVDGAPLNASQPSAHHDIAMLNKEYAPGEQVVRKGDVINFVNEDKIQHNVFSSSGENAFDLGTYGGGLERAVSLNEDGIVKVYCNIHPDMATYIAVDDVSLSKIVDDTNSFSFPQLPAADYELTLWSIRGEKSVQISLAEEETKNFQIVFDTTAFEQTGHANKFGEEYRNKRKQRYNAYGDELF